MEGLIQTQNESRDQMSEQIHILNNRARRLSIFTVGYNVLEGFASIVVAALSGSTALLGFGFDSCVESLSGGVMIWRFKKRESMTQEQLENIEAKAIRLVGWSFFILGGYVILEASTQLYFREIPEKTLFGIMIAIASLIVMPFLFVLKVRTARALNSRSLLADSRQTLGCVLLSLALLIGLAGNYLAGYWWMDPIAALFIALFLFREGYEALAKKELCC